LPLASGASHHGHHPPIYPPSATMHTPIHPTRPSATAKPWGGEKCGLGIDLRFCCPICNERLNGTPKICPRCHSELFILIEDYGHKKIVTKEIYDARNLEKQEQKERRTKIDEIMRL
ncbi:MAG TPA: hypothetical protein VIH42_09755, partial [Thermoguttaceae bacterium]